MPKYEPAVATLAYALYDSENTTRLSEERSGGIVDDYFKRAHALLYMIKEYQVKKHRVALSRAIRNG